MILVELAEKSPDVRVLVIHEERVPPLLVNEQFVQPRLDLFQLPKHARLLVVLRTGRVDRLLAVDVDRDLEGLDAVVAQEILDDAD